MSVYDLLSNYEFILGSQSPQRCNIVEKQLNISNLKLIPSSFPEDLPKTGSNESYVKQTCLKKCEYVLKQLDHNKKRIVLCSDTIVVCDDQIFEKPEDDREHIAMFDQYKLAPIKVMTAVTIVKIEEDGSIRKVCDVETTQLEFDTNVSDDLIRYYVKTGEGSNAAGGFKIQGMGNIFFPKVIGDYSNVVGLPVYRTFQMLREIFDDIKR